MRWWRRGERNGPEGPSVVDANDVLAGAGLALLSLGAALIYGPAGCIVLGLGLIAAALMRAAPRQGRS